MSESEPIRHLIDLNPTHYAAAVISSESFDGGKEFGDIAGIIFAQAGQEFVGWVESGENVFLATGIARNNGELFIAKLGAAEIDDIDFAEISSFVTGLDHLETGTDLPWHELKIE